MWWMERLHRPPVAVLQVVVEVGNILAEAWEAIEMAVSQDVFCSHLQKFATAPHILDGALCANVLPRRRQLRTLHI